MANKLTVDEYNLISLDTISGFEVRPGFYEINGATAIPCGVNFTIHSNQATYCELLLFKRDEEEPYAIIPFPDNYRIGNVFSMIVFNLNINQFEYAYRLDGPYNPSKGIIFDRTKTIIDPYAKAVTGQREWGVRNRQGNQYRARVVKDNFDWGNCKQPLTPIEDLIIYEMHVRGFTKDDSSGIEQNHRGTFAGIIDKLPYLKELGITAVELMPIFEFDEMAGKRQQEGKDLYDYWGYNTVCFFAPKTSYSSKIEHNREGNELKELIRTLNENGIEVFLDVVFNHTAEGNEQGPFFSFKGLDNNIYYLLTPEGYYYNFSGCGNTLNCNHPIVQQMILECLRYWVINYHVDGFRFDLASILGRSETGAPLNNPPLLQSLAFDPILGDVKLIAEAWDAGGLYQVGSFPAWNRWMEWNGRYRDDLRSFLKGDSGKAVAALDRIQGSVDMYGRDSRGFYASINFLTCHDGFTMHDLYSYNEKHNYDNGWNNTDGNNDNLSWNCGIEGETDNTEVNNLRARMVKNAIATLMVSRGTPMFLAGDEFGNTQFGNNNPYCQDNITSWLDWNKLKENKNLFEFTKGMIQFRKNHDPIRKQTDRCSLNYPEVTYHNGKAWDSYFNEDSHFAGIMFSGRTNRQDDIIFIALNSYWEELDIELPQLPPGYNWKIKVDTFREESIIDKTEIVYEKVHIMPRTIMVLTI